jgi:hypothetical protein
MCENKDGFTPEFPEGYTCSCPEGTAAATQPSPATCTVDTHVWGYTADSPPDCSWTESQEPMACEEKQGCRYNSAASCEDIDECAADNACAAGQQCMNMFAKPNDMPVMCMCADGFQATNNPTTDNPAAMTCVNVDECAWRWSVCGPRKAAECTDKTPTSDDPAKFTCSCSDKFIGVSFDYDQSMPHYMMPYQMTNDEMCVLKEEWWIDGYWETDCSVAEGGGSCVKTPASGSGTCVHVAARESCEMSNPCETNNGGCWVDAADENIKQECFNMGEIDPSYFPTGVECGECPSPLIGGPDGAGSYTDDRGTDNTEDDETWTWGAWPTKPCFAADMAVGEPDLSKTSWEIQLDGDRPFEASKDQLLSAEVSPQCHNHSTRPSGNYWETRTQHSRSRNHCHAQTHDSEPAWLRRALSCWSWWMRRR